MNVFILKSVVDKLVESGKLRMELAIALNVGERAVWLMCQRELKDPKPNSSLTKLAAINYFRSIGLTDQEIYFEK